MLFTNHPHPSSQLCLRIPTVVLAALSMRTTMSRMHRRQCASKGLASLHRGRTALRSHPSTSRRGCDLPPSLPRRAWAWRKHLMQGAFVSLSQVAKELHAILAMKLSHARLLLMGSRRTGLRTTGSRTTGSRKARSRTTESRRRQPRILLLLWVTLRRVIC